MNSRTTVNRLKLKLFTPGLVLCLLLLLLTSAATVHGQFPFVGVINADRVHIRSGGGKNYVILNTVGKGELVVVHGQAGGKKEWYRCVYPRPLLGYITTLYVKKTSEGQGVCTAQRVNLRPSPSVLHPPIDQVKIGTRLRITGEKKGFYEVVIPEEMMVWIHKDFVRNHGPIEKFAKELMKIREESHRAFRNPKGKEAKAVTADSPPGKEAGEKGKKNPGKAAAGEKKDPGKKVRKERLARLDSLRKRFESGKVKKDLPGMKGVLGDLMKLEEEVIKDKDDYSKYKVNQLITNVRLAIVEVDSVVNPKVSVREIPRPDPGSRISQTGWLKKDSKLFSHRTVYKLVKGNIVLYHLTTQKYDLSKFLDKHVVVSGKIKQRKNAMENVVLEVMRLKVLSQ